jgi:integrase
MVKDTIRCMSLYKVGNIWYYYLTVKGERYRNSTGTSDKKEAQRIHDKIRDDLQQRKSSGYTLADALRLWLTDKERTDKEKSAVRVLLRCYPSRPLTEFSPHELVASLKGRKDSTINRTINIVNAALKLAHEQGKCGEYKIKRKPPSENRLRFLTKEEWDTLESNLADHVKAIAGFAVSTGLRYSNVVGLKWRNVDLKRHLVWVDSVDSKSRKTISVPLSEKAVSILKQQEGKHKEFVFTYGGAPIKSIKTSWNKSLVKAGIDIYVEKNEDGDEIKKSSFRFHDLRHTWASWHVQNGTPLAVLKELGGWHSMELVMRYSHLAPDHLRAYVNNV